MKFSKIALAASIALAAAASQAAVAPSNLIINGDFETYAPSFSSGYQVLNVGNTDLTGWTIGGASVDIIKGAYGAIAGNSIDMLGSPGPGSLSQSFASVVGQTYVLNFDLSRNSNVSPYVNVAFGGATQTQFTGGLSGATPNQFALSYTAVSTTTTLAFYSVGGAGSGGAVLDNVSVTAVPEPETYAMLLAGLGLMGAVARRRKNKQA